MSQDQHASMFAAAVIMQRGKRLIAADLVNQAVLIKRPVFCTDKTIFSNIKARQQAGGGADMVWLAVMAGTGHAYLCRGQRLAKPILLQLFNERDSLQRFHCRAGKDRPFCITVPQNNTPIAIDNRDIDQMGGFGNPGAAYVNLQRLFIQIRQICRHGHPFAVRVEQPLNPNL